ncbi:probable plastid-lipid-associated protein 11, chloroplastic [Dioscorea cayenensis subsp. rotundata]|uniref:Probable plastid-lipid-associated protein 11, chloroplastic n=1 Tax=Dioscorea cayennensis subsp. rotundata TaxID=55577 RepID=A0AB40CR74_DIOCR|nr:probable plastid-lipid-associated protein 11, chloroplastic [Dioscorea cayenensis subsp. rotundata]
MIVSSVLLAPPSPFLRNPNPNPNPNPSSPIPPKPHRLPRPPSSQSPSSTAPLLPKSLLLSLISDQDRGIKTQSNPSKRAEIIQAIEDLAVLSAGTITTGPALSATWRMLWTTEKEQLFIIKNAGLFGTAAGDVLQVIDVGNGVLNNVITFPPDGVFFVRSSIDPAPPQRVNFKFTSAVLRGSNWEIPLPPFGQGWFESVYMDDEIRVAKDIRGDYLVVDRAPYSWKE